MGRNGRALTGLAVGALLSAILLAISALSPHLGFPSVAFSVFEWLIRVLPGRLVIFGLETTLRVLEGLGFNIKNTAKTVEEVLAYTSLFVGGALVGLLFFALVQTGDWFRVRAYGLAVGGALGVFSLVVVFVEEPPNSVSYNITAAVLVMGQFLLWGWGLARLYAAVTLPPGLSEAPASVRPAPSAERAPVGPALSEPAPSGTAPSAEVVRIDRRRFLIRMGGLAATIVVLGAEVAEIISVEGGPKVPALVKAPIPFPNADSPIEPVPGTRPEYTAVADHYRVDIDLSPPHIDPASWRLKISGLVAHPLVLTLDQLKSRYHPSDQFVTLSCISNPVGGP